MHRCGGVHVKKGDEPPLAPYGYLDASAETFSGVPWPHTLSAKRFYMLFVHEFIFEHTFHVIYLTTKFSFEA